MPTMLTTLKTTEFLLPNELSFATPPGWFSLPPLAAGTHFIATAPTPQGHVERTTQALPEVLRLTGWRPGLTEDTYTVLIPADDESDVLAPGVTVEMTGPFCPHGFSPAADSSHFVVTVDLLDDAGWLALIAPLLEPLLDRGGRVMLLVVTGTPIPDLLRSRLPLAVEMNVVGSVEEWLARVGELAPWSDQLFAATAHHHYPSLISVLRETRFHLQPGYAQVLVQADLLCSYGACLACAVPTASGGFTRACVHGPVLDLTRLVA